MQVDFYRANEQNAPTVDFYLFTKELSQIMNGEYIEEAGQHYQVISQPIPDQPAFPEREAVEGRSSGRATRANGFCLPGATQTG